MESAQCSADGKWVVTASEDNTARVWEAATGKERTPQPLRHEAPVQSAAFSPDGRWVVTACLDANAWIWPLGSPYSTSDLLLFAEVLSGKRVDDQGVLVRLTLGERKRAWEQWDKHRRGLPIPQ